MSSQHRGKDNSAPEMPSPELLAEAKKVLPPQLLQKFVGDIENLRTDKQVGPMGNVGPYKGYRMDFDQLMLHHDNQAMGTIAGSNYMVNKDVPKGRFYVDSNYDDHEVQPVSTHESIETHLMDKHGWPYAKAHPVANHFEKQVREQQQPQEQQQFGGIMPQPSPQQTTQPPQQSPLEGMMPKIGGQL